MNWFKKLFGENRTVVYLRSHKTPAHHWEAVVRYDAWGSPYTVGRGSGPSWGEVALLAGGETSETRLYGTEWAHKSGPPVTFGTKPKSPFDRDPGQ